METKRIGRHVMKSFSPTLTYVHFDGDLSGPEAKTMSLQLAEWSVEEDTVFISDITRLGTFGAEARKELAAERKPRLTDKPLTTTLVFIGATMRTKVLMSVLLTGVRLLSNQKMDTVYFALPGDAAAFAKVDPALLAP